MVDLDHQQLGPLHGPDFGELLALQQAIDQLGPLVADRIGHEGVVLFLGRQQAGDVDRRAAEELFVAAELAGQHAELLAAWRRPARRCSCRRSCGGGVLQVLGQHQHLAADGVRREAGHDEGFAAGGGGHQAVGVIGAELSLFVRNMARFVTSRSVPSA